MSKRKKKRVPQKSQRWWKLSIFVLGMLAVIGLVGYAIINRSNSDKALAQASLSRTPVSAPVVAGKTPSATAINDMNWLKNARTSLAQHDFMFIVLPVANGSIEPTVAGAAEKIQVQGVRVDTLALNATDPEVVTTSQLLGINTLPAVVALNASGQAAIVTGEITETKLLQAYLSCASSQCAPGASR